MMLALMQARRCLHIARVDKSGTDMQHPRGTQHHDTNLMLVNLPLPPTGGREQSIAAYMALMLDNSLALICKPLVQVWAVVMDDNVLCSPCSCLRLLHSCSPFQRSCLLPSMEFRSWPPAGLWAVLVPQSADSRCEVATAAPLWHLHLNLAKTETALPRPCVPKLPAPAVDGVAKRHSPKQRRNRQWAGPHGRLHPCCLPVLLLLLL